MNAVQSLPRMGDTSMCLQNKINAPPGEEVRSPQLRYTPTTVLRLSQTLWD